MVRLAALLHDLTHCIFSHVSEPLYERDPRVENERKRIRELFKSIDDDPEIGAAEALTYSLITSERFGRFFKAIRSIVGKESLPEDVSPVDIARLIVGLPPQNHTDRVYLAQIINGPFDADKLDYQARDGYFTGVTMPVDIDRLLASLCVGERKNQRVLAVDHRGIAPLEQLLFNRMLLYDSVYHHHKIRTAVRLFSRSVERSGALDLDWLIDHDEYDFMGGKYSPDSDLGTLVRRLRERDLPRRAVVISPTTINDEDSSGNGEKWKHRIAQFFSVSDPVDREIAGKWLKGIEDTMKELLPEEFRDSFYIDIPKPPKFQRIQNATYVRFAKGHLVQLDDIFKNTSALSSYAQQAKYRIYVFAEKGAEVSVAAAAYRAFSRGGMELNEEAFRLAKLDPTEVSKKAGSRVPERRPEYGIHAS